MEAYNSILLKRQFEILMSVDILTERLSLKKDDDFTVRVIDKYNYEIIAYSSLGTMRGTGGVFDGIKVHVTFEPSAANKTSVTLGTHLRIELYFVLVIMIFLGIAGYSTFSIWAYIFFPFFIFFWWIVYRFQENTLADDVENYLVKQPRMG